MLGGEWPLSESLGQFVRVDCKEGGDFFSGIEHKKRTKDIWESPSLAKLCLSSNQHAPTQASSCEILVVLDNLDLFETAELPLIFFIVWCFENGNKVDLFLHSIRARRPEVFGRGQPSTFELNPRRVDEFSSSDRRVWLV